jgi:aspartyl-tRNA(Asn)/glutamyl-tRNA(Gln) amidotransferase subunit C
MSNFTEEDLRNLERLCRIKLNPDEEKKFVPNIKKILDYMEQLNEIETENVSPCNYVLKEMQHTIMREDIVEEHLDKEKFLNNAPDQIGGMIRVLPIIKPIE